MWGETINQAGFKAQCHLFQNLNFHKKSPASDDAGLFYINFPKD